MKENDVIKLPKEPLVIFRTDADRKKQNIALMSNFFDGYIGKLCTIDEKTDKVKIVNDVAISNIDLIKEVTKKLKV